MDTFPLRIKENLSEEVLSQIPILRQARRLLQMVKESGGLRMTKNGNLPVKVIPELYDLGVPEFMIEHGYCKLHREDQSDGIRLMHYLISTAGAVRMSKGSLVLTKKGQHWLDCPQGLLKEMLDTLAWKTDVGSLDGYKVGNINPGIPMTCLLLHQYGEEPRPSGFYADELAKYLPELSEIPEPVYSNPAHYRSQCFAVRLIMRGLNLFALADFTNGEYDIEAQRFRDGTVTRMPLFGDVFEYVGADAQNLYPPCDPASVTLHSKAEAMALLFALRAIGSQGSMPLS